MKPSFLWVIILCFIAPVLSARRSSGPSKSLRRVQARQEQGVTKPGCVLKIDHYECQDGTTCTQSDGVWQCHGADGSLQGPDGSAIVDPTSDGGECRSTSSDYNLPLHIGAIFIILAASLIGVGLPIVAGSMSACHSPVFTTAFFVFRHFGTGIIIATAFIHLLFSASETFSDPCLTGIAFAPTPQAISMGGIYLVFLIDFFAMRYISQKNAGALPTTSNISTPPPATKSACHPHGSPSSETELPIRELDAFTHDHHSHIAHEVTDYSSDQAHFDVALLEAGIIFHSIMVGVTIGASEGDDYTPLLIAIVFHQMFEGLGLGARIALLKFKSGKEWNKWLMSAAFAFTTPIGIAIGIGVRFSFQPNSQGALLAVGILDGVSSGILLYAGLVELLAHDFMRDDLRMASNGRVALALISLFAGTALMSLLGNWA